MDEFIDNIKALSYLKEITNIREFIYIQKIMNQSQIDNIDTIISLTFIKYNNNLNPNNIMIILYELIINLDIDNIEITNKFILDNNDKLREYRFFNKLLDNLSLFIENINKIKNIITIIKKNIDIDIEIKNTNDLFKIIILNNIKNKCTDSENNIYNILINDYKNNQENINNIDDILKLIKKFNISYNLLNESLNDICFSNAIINLFIYKEINKIINKNLFNKLDIIVISDDDIQYIKNENEINNIINNEEFVLKKIESDTNITSYSNITSNSNNSNSNVASNSDIVSDSYIGIKYIIHGMGCENFNTFKKDITITEKKNLDITRKWCFFRPNIISKSHNIKSSLYILSMLYKHRYLGDHIFNDLDFLNRIIIQILYDLNNSKKVTILSHSFGGAIANRIAEILDMGFYSENNENNEDYDFIKKIIKDKNIDNYNELIGLLNIITFGSIYISNKIKNINIINYVSKNDYSVGILEKNNSKFHINFDMHYQLKHKDSIICEFGKKNEIFKTIPICLYSITNLTDKYNFIESKIYTTNKICDKLDNNPATEKAIIHNGYNIFMDLIYQIYKINTIADLTILGEINIDKLNIKITKI